MAVIKADAYGHGAAECSRRLESEGVDWFGVATLEEGVELRRAGTHLPILIFGGIWPGQELTFLDLELTPMVFTLEQSERANAAARSAGKTIEVHVKIDTGMNRVGFRWDQAEEIAHSLSGLSNLKVEGLMTHFAVADRISENDFTDQQIARFTRSVDYFLRAGHRPKIIDMANSPGAIAHPQSRAKLVRIGGALFGVTGDLIPTEALQPELLPVMSVYTRIAMIKRVPRGETIGYGRTFTTERESLIATVPIGYNDGYDRALSNQGEMIVRGRKVPIVGRISMDWITLDITDTPAAEVGDIVTVLGSDGEALLTAEEIARKIDTITYEITCGISRRVPRIYKQGAQT